MLFSQTIRIEYEFFTAPFHCVVFSNLLLFSSADWLPTSENCFVWANFKSTLGRIARLQLSWGSFAFHARLTLLSFLKKKLCQLLNRLRFGVMKRELLILEKFEQWCESLPTNFQKMLRTPHWRKQMVKVRFIIFSICLVRRQEVDKGHISFFSKFLPLRLQSYVLVVEREKNSWSSCFNIYSLTYLTWLSRSTT